METLNTFTNLNQLNINLNVEQNNMATDKLLLTEPPTCSGETMPLQLNDSSQPMNHNISQIKINIKREKRRINARKKRLRRKAESAMIPIASTSTNDNASILSKKRSSPVNPKPTPEERPSEKVLQNMDNGLTVTQRSNPLTMIVVHLNYPEIILSAKHLGSLRRAVREEVDKLPPNQWPKFNDSFCRGGALIIIAADEEAKNWFSNQFEILKKSIGEAVQLGGVELLQRFRRAIVRVSDSRTLEKSTRVVLERLDKFNPTLNTKLWKVTGDFSDGKKDVPAEMKKQKDGRFIIVRIPDCAIPPLKQLHFRPYYDLGRVRVKLKGPPSYDKDQKK